MATLQLTQMQLFKAIDAIDKKWNEESCYVFVEFSNGFSIEIGIKCDIDTHDYTYSNWYENGYNDYTEVTHCNTEINEINVYAPDDEEEQEYYLSEADEKVLKDFVANDSRMNF